jgi:hypothetical protein
MQREYTRVARLSYYFSVSFEQGSAAKICARRASIRLLPHDRDTQLAAIGAAMIVDCTNHERPVRAGAHGICSEGSRVAAKRFARNV